jgi:dTMP kinase
MRPGFFISFESTEGCGKSTQITRLAARLRDSHREILLTREPGGTESGEEIRHLLQYAKAGHGLTPEAELLLFAASRAQLVREKIQPALDRGAIVISDRFLDSTTVYQGVARRLDPATVEQINRFAVGACVPDITFVLDLDPSVARARLENRENPAPHGDRMESQPISFYQAVVQGYRDLAAREPRRIRIIDAAPSADEVEAAIWQHLAPHFSP